MTLPNFNLIPEYAYNLSTGWNQNINLFNNTFSCILKAVGYTTLLENAIQKELFNVNGIDSINYYGLDYQILANQNIDQALVYGYNLILDINLKKYWKLHSGLCYTKGISLYNTDPLQHIPPLIGKFSLSYERHSLGITIFSHFNGWKRLENFGIGNVDNPLEATTDGYPSWITYNIKASYNLNKQLSFNLGCYNICDIHYKYFASGISAPGRSLLMSILLTY